MLMHEPALEPPPTTRKDLKTLLEDYEKALILEALQAKNGNQRQAAFALGILPTTLARKAEAAGTVGVPLRRIDGGRVGIDIAADLSRSSPTLSKSQPSPKPLQWTV